MAKKLSPLTATLTLEINKWTVGIKAVQRDSEALTKSLKPIKEQATQIGTAFTAVGAAVGGAMLLLAKKAADYGDAILDASKKTGISTQQLAGIKILADQSGTSFEAMSKGVNLLSKNMFAAATKGGESAKLFKAVGISIKDANGNLKNAQEILPEIADLFAKMEDGTQKTALAMKFFGKSGAEMIPALNEGAAGFKKATEAAEKYGTAITRAEAVMHDQFNDTLEESKTALLGFALAVGNAIIPALTKLIEKANDWIAAISKWVREHPKLTQVVGATAAALFGAGGLLLGLAGIATIAPKVYSGVMLMTSGFKSVAGAVTGFIAAQRAAQAALALQKAQIAASATGISLAQAQVFTAAKNTGAISLLFSGITAKVSGLASAFTKLLPVLGKVSFWLGAIILTKQISDWTGYTGVVKDAASELLRLADNLGKVGAKFATVAKDETVKFFNNLSDSIGSLLKNLPGIGPYLDQIHKKLNGIMSLGGESDSFGGFVTDSFLNSMIPIRGLGQAAKKINEEIEKRNPFLHVEGGSSTADVEKIAPPPKIDLGLDTEKLSEVEQMWKSLKREAKEAEDLTAVLMRADAAHMDISNTVDILGPRIQDVADDFRRTGEIVPEIIAKYDSYRRNSLELKAAKEEETRAIQESNLALLEAEQRMEQAAKELPHELKTQAAERINEVVIERDAATQATIDNVIANAQHRKEIERASDRLKLHVDIIKKDAAAIESLANEGLTASQIEAALGVSIESVSQAAKDLGIVLPETTRKVMLQSVEARKLSDSWEQTFGAISDSLVDMIVDFDFSMGRLKSIGLDTAKSLARSFLDGFFAPFKEGLKGLGKEAGEWASGLLFGMNKVKTEAQQEEGSGGLLGGLLGLNGGSGLLGGLIGGNMPSVTQTKTGGLLGGIFGNIFGRGGTPPFVPGSGGGLLDMLGLGDLKNIFSQTSSGGGLSSVLGMGGGLPGEGYAKLASTVIETISKGWKPGQKLQNEGTKIFQEFFDQILKIRDPNSGLSASKQLKLINDLHAATVPAAAKFSGAASLINKAVTDQRLYLEPLAELEDDSGDGMSFDVEPFNRAVEKFAEAVRMFAERGVVATVNLPSNLTTTSVGTPAAIGTGSPIAMVSSAFRDLREGLTQASQTETAFSAVLLEFLNGSQWQSGLQNVINPLLTAQQAGTLTQTQIASALSSFDVNVLKFREIADSIIRVGGLPNQGMNATDVKAVQDGYSLLNPLIEKLRQTLADAAAEVTSVPKLALGGLLKTPGLVFAHAGEVVMPQEAFKKMGNLGKVVAALWKKVSAKLPTQDVQGEQAIKTLAEGMTSSFKPLQAVAQKMFGKSESFKSASTPFSEVIARKMFNRTSSDTPSPSAFSMMGDLVRATTSTSSDQAASQLTVENLYVQLKDVTTPEQLVRWIKLDKAGLRTEVIKSGKLASGLVTAV